MLFSPIFPLVFTAIVVSGAVIDRALPPGHPILSEGNLPQANFTLDPIVWPSGFVIPTETLTGLPSGYSVGPTAVWNPEGQVVSSLPPDAISQVAVRPTSVSASSSVSTPRGSGTRSGSTPSKNGNGAGQNANIGSVVVYVAGFMASRVLF